MRQRTLHRTAVCCTVFVVLLLESGCGRTHEIPEGELEIHNTWGSRGTVYGLEIEEIGGPNFLAFDVRARPGDTVRVDVFPSLYDVWIFWADGELDVYTDVEVHECCTTDLMVHR